MGWGGGCRKRGSLSTAKDYTERAVEREREETRRGLSEVRTGGGVFYKHGRVMCREVGGRMEDKWRLRSVETLLVGSLKRETIECLSRGDSLLSPGRSLRNVSGSQSSSACAKAAAMRCYQSEKLDPRSSCPQCPYSVA